MNCTCSRLARVPEPELMLEEEQALAYAQAAHEFALETGSSPFLALAEALEIRLTLASGVLADASRRSQEIDTSVNESNTV